MILPIKGGVITSPFNEPRPLEGAKTHVHGALDVARGDGIALAPVSGVARAYLFLRSQTPWSRTDKTEILAVPAREYWYDLFGGVIEIRADDGTYHLMTHFYGSVLQERFGPFKYIESNVQTRTPTIMLASNGKMLSEGDKLCAIGNAGYSTGPHIHWEIHPTPSIYLHSGRIDPEALLS